MAKKQNKPTHPSIERVRKLARLMDSALTVPVIRKKVGLDPLLSLVPGGGDAIAALISLYPVYVAYELGLPRDVLVKMGANVAIDTLIGLVPVAGDVADVFWKANIRNLEILEAAYEAHQIRQASGAGARDAVIDVEAEPAG